MLASCLHKANAVFPNVWVWDSFLLRGRLCVQCLILYWDVRKSIRKGYPVREEGAEEKIRKEVYVRDLIKGTSPLHRSCGLNSSLSPSFLK
jgi:hypothetical protein